MDPTRKLEETLDARVVASRPVSGGCIAEAKRLELSDGRTVFVKLRAQHHDMFPKEAAGLKAISLSGALRTPTVLGVEAGFLALEWVESSTPREGFSAAFGRALANLHRSTNETFGFHVDNYIGATPQPNRTRCRGWTDFFWHERLLFQLRLAEEKGVANEALCAAFAMLEHRIADVLEGSEEPPALIHGDLWSGNYMVDEHGGPCVFDPAVYFGHREAELGMTRLFGGFDRAFYKAYDETWPLVEGWRRREGLYKLYHVMNHLNLFGGSYLSQALTLIRSYR